MASHAAGHFFRAGREPPSRLPLPVPDAGFTGESLKVPASTRKSYKQLADIGVDSNKLQGLDKNINLYNPQCNVNGCFSNNLSTFFVDWWNL